MRSNLNPRITIKSFSTTDKGIFKRLSSILKIIEEENKIIKRIIKEKDNKTINKIISPNTEITDMMMIKIEIITGRISIRKKVEIYSIIIGIQSISKKDLRNKHCLRVFSFRRKIKRTWLRLNAHSSLRMFM